MIFIGDATMAPFEITAAGSRVEHCNEETGYIWMKRFVEKLKMLI